MPNINQTAPKYRDTQLNYNIGKYSVIDIPFIHPIGKYYDFNDIQKSKNLTSNGLLEYTNSNTEINQEKRNLNSQPFEYKNYIDLYTPEKNYIDSKKSIFNDILNTSLSFFNSDSVGVSISNSKLDVGGSFNYNNTIVGRSANVLLGNETKLGENGLKSLALAAVNSTISNSQREIKQLEWIKKPTNYVDAIDKVDTETMGIKVGDISTILPIYLYSQIQNEKKLNNFIWVNKSIKTEKIDSTNGNVVGTETSDQLIHIDENGTFYSLNSDFNKQSLLYKTQQMFKSGKIQTMITDVVKFNYDSDNLSSENRITRGRNLSKRDANDDVCRNWTVANQYRKVSNLIRPFKGTDNEKIDKYLERVRPNGVEYLRDFGVLQKDGFLKISPYKNEKPDGQIKKYMFSIENLAWKDSLDDMTKKSSQEGPNGGRIMWFPPYDIKFTDNTSTQLNSDVFIGRGEPVYTYVNTERTGTLGFKIIVDHPSILNYFKENGNFTNDDYNRFFAGCDVRELELKKEEIKSDKDPVKKVPPSDIKPKIYKIKVYFPNNLSGVNFNSIDDLFEYLYHGHRYNKDGGYGYEITDGSWKGLNLSNDTSISEQDCSTNTNIKGSYYVVDKNTYCQNISVENKKDNYSYGLNSKTDNTDYSFKNFYEAINSISAGIAYNEEIQNILKTTTSIEISGAASFHGEQTINKKLAEQRANSIKKWFKGGKCKQYMTSIKDFEKDITIGNTPVNSKPYKSGDDVNALEAKKDRFALITLTSMPSSQNEIPNTTNENIKGVENANKNSDNTNETSLYKRELKDMYGYSKDKKSDEFSKNDEAMFFEEMGINYDFVMKEYKEKIKYFQPAFHSTTPEGFNERLTFLHQCMRQGPTKNSVNVATNLAFGRPPICILRVGDFYNTKVVFDSLNIDFEPLVWDLNPEGVGVQPMLANISMNFKFIGGSDLTGPIARLQNAVTFNFYANTGVYDNRNDGFKIEKGNVISEEYKLLHDPYNYELKKSSTTAEEENKKIAEDKNKL